MTSALVDAGRLPGYDSPPAMLPSSAQPLLPHPTMRIASVFLLSFGVAALLLLPRLAASGEGRQSGIGQVAWLAGCWERSSGNRIVEEQWMRPRGGTMLGMARTIRGDSTVEWEHLRIADERDTLVYHAMPSRQAPAAFRAIRVASDTVIFENRAHDFPQRIIYRRSSADSLHARVEGTMQGQPRGVDFRFQRVACSI